MEEKKIYYYSTLTMRSLIEAVNKCNIRKNDIVQFLYDGLNYTVIYEL